MAHGNDRLAKRILYGNERINGEIVGSTHPSAYLGFFFPETQCEILLLKSLAFQDFMYPVILLVILHSACHLRDGGQQGQVPYPVPAPSPRMSHPG